MVSFPFPSRLVLLCLLAALLAGCRSPAPGFFPLGIYAPGNSTNSLAQIHSAGFNLVTGPASREFLQAAGLNQLHVLASIPSFHEPVVGQASCLPVSGRLEACPTTKVVQGSKALSFVSGEFSPGQSFSSLSIESTVRQYDSNPNLWAWYIVDEPDLNGISPADVAQANQVVKQSGRKPTALVLYSGSDALDYAAIPDILMIDRYPVPWLPLANFSQNVRLARFAAGPEKPLIAVIQSFDWNYYPDLVDNRPNLRVPTYEEIRCMTYCALAEGANGLFYYAYDDGKWRMSEHPATWDALRKVVGEVNQRLPLFTARHPWSGVYATYTNWESGWNEALNSAVTTVLLEVDASRDGSAGRWPAVFGDPPNTSSNHLRPSPSGAEKVSWTKLSAGRRKPHAGRVCSPGDTYSAVPPGRYLLSVNTTARTVNYQVHLPTWTAYVPGRADLPVSRSAQNSIGNQTLPVFEEHRNVLVKAGVFSDEIGPYAVHIYGPF